MPKKGRKKRTIVLWSISTNVIDAPDVVTLNGSSDFWCWDLEKEGGFLWNLSLDPYHQWEILATMIFTSPSGKVHIPKRWSSSFGSWAICVLILMKSFRKDLHGYPSNQTAAFWVKRMRNPKNHVFYLVYTSKNLLGLCSLKPSGLWPILFNGHP